MNEAYSIVETIVLAAAVILPALVLVRYVYSLITGSRRSCCRNDAPGGRVRRACGCGKQPGAGTSGTV